MHYPTGISDIQGPCVQLAGTAGGGFNEHNPSAEHWSSTPGRKRGPTDPINTQLLIY